MFASQLSGHCDVIADRLWRHQQNVKRASETRGLCVEILVLASFMDSLCRVRTKTMYVLLWRTVYALTRVLFWCLFPSLLRNSGNEHQDNPLVSALTVRHASAYIILYIFTHISSNDEINSMLLWKQSSVLDSFKILGNNSIMYFLCIKTTFAKFLCTSW